MGFLYINSKGSPWRKHSYSAGNDWDHDSFSYYLRRVLGWKLKDNRAAFKFGRALEEAVQVYHEDEIDPVEDFKRRWSAHKETKDLIYTKVEKDWETAGRMGEEMMQLYVIRQKKLPIPLGTRSVWQKEVSKEIFPGDLVYGEIEDVGKLDIICYNDPDCSWLPHINWRVEDGVYRPLIVDIKTSSKDFPEQQGMAAFDLQLRRYSFLSGIRDVGLLWFKKTSHTLSKGSSATLLQTAFHDGMAAGDEVVVAQTDVDNRVWIVRNDFFLGEMERAQGRNAGGKLDTTKAATARKQQWLENNAVLVPEEFLTRQRIQFNCGRVTDESAEDAGLIAARQIKGIVDAWNTNKYPQTMGVRYPSDDTNDPYFRAFVMKDNIFKEANFIKKDEESFSDLFADITEVEWT